MAGSRQSDGMLATCQLSASCCYRAELQEFVIRSIPISDVGGQCETKRHLSWTRRSLLFWCLYNLQHKDYDNNLVKDSSRKEIAGELNAQDKEISRSTQHCRRVAGSWQGNGMVCVNRP
jgi:hypothetical protein